MATPATFDDHDGHYQPGDVVLTTYGSGVLVGAKNGQFTVRLWRQIGKSISSAALAFLDARSIIRKIPAAPGMTTFLTDPESLTKRQVLVLSFSPSTDSYLVCSITTDDKHFNIQDGGETPSSRHLNASTCLTLENSSPKDVVSAKHLDVAPSAKFYPLLETLMLRGDETVHAATGLLTNERTRKFVDKTERLLRDKVQGFSVPVSNDGNSTDKLYTMAASLESAAASVDVDETVRQVLGFVKDKDFTDLLQTCRFRLSNLTAENGIIKLSTEVLSKAAIHFNADSLPSSYAVSVDSSRKAALASLEQLLQDLDVGSSDLEALQSQVSSRFAQAFDSLSSAAKSDESLNTLFQSVHEKTRVWQDATGRLLATRSGSLFLEGANRLQQRAAAILGTGSLQWTGEIGTKLIKSFTEGDAALARLKSIELADVVKDSLVQAIETRSESIGGLDGIIANSLSHLKTGTTKAGDSLQDLLNGLQKGASSSAVNAHETLLSVLSARSVYRDTALLQIESVLCGLSDHFGNGVSPDDIARTARGDGGTAKLFEPIAKQAMMRIDQQLDLAESSITDATALTVLHRVRQITSGEMSLPSLMDDLVSVLNDDSFVSTSEAFVQQSEQVLDILEGVSASRAVNDALQLAEKAGITKGSVMNELERLDVSDLVTTAGSAITDDRARQKLLSTATDVALDFILRILPSMQMPPFDGVKDGLIYNISNLSMEGFKVRKEDIQIELAGMRATRRQSGNGLCSADLPNRDPSGSPVKPTDLLIIDIRSISAVLDDAKWSFEQTYMPYMNGNGLANIRFKGGAIRLQFELRRQRNKINRAEWEPVLCLHDRSCSIAEVDLSLQGESTLAWIVNKAASVFKGPLRDYIVRTVVNVLINHSGWILQRMNKVLSPHWGLIMHTAKLTMNDLVEADERVVSTETSAREQSFVELVWREQLPLGINLLLNDESGFLKVVDFPRGSQARAVCERKGLAPDIFKGARIVAVNGSHYAEDLDDLFAALKEPGRPKTIRFEVADSDEAERIRFFVSGNETPESNETSATERRASFRLRQITLSNDDEVGLSFCRSLDNLLAVEGFIEGEDGVVLVAERSRKVKTGDLLIKVNKSFVQSCEHALELLEKGSKCRPMELSFIEPYLYVNEISRSVDDAGGGDELRLLRRGQKIMISGFNDISGKAERSGIFIGDHLVFVNGQPVGAGCRWLGIQPAPRLVDVLQMIAQEEAYPMGLTFARPTRERESRKAFGDDEAETICVTLERPDELGCLIQQTQTHDLVVADFQSIPGKIQSSLRRHPMGLSIQAINGQTVPSYASEDMVRSAINRSWKVEGKVELWLCDEKLKEWLQHIKNE